MVETFHGTLARCLRRGLRLAFHLAPLLQRRRRDVTPRRTSRAGNAPHSQRAARRCRPEREIAVFGNQYPTNDGTPIRDYIHVADLADAHILVLQHLRREGKTDALNLGTGRGYSVLEVIDTARRITGRPIRVRMEGPRPGDPAQLVADPARARTILSWTPAMSDLDSIISSAWEWHKKHPRGYNTPAKWVSSPLP